MSERIRSPNPVSRIPAPPYGSAAYFRRAALWWWHEAKTSACPSRCLDYAKGQIRLAKWIEINPKKRPRTGETHWQMFQRHMQEKT